MKLAAVARDAAMDARIAKVCAFIMSDDEFDKMFGLVLK